MFLIDAVIVYELRPVESLLPYDTTSKER